LGPRTTPTAPAGRVAPVEVGPFVIGVDPATANPGINYATPLPGAAITPADVQALVAAFRRVDRQPRLEYVTSCAPALEALLIGAGFAVEARHEYLVCTPDSLVPTPPPGGFVLREPGGDRDRAALVRVQHESFGAEPPAETIAADVARFRRLQAKGGVAVMAVTAADGVCAAGGQAVPPNGGVSEVAGIVTRQPFRRRGLAGAVTAAITARLFAGGAGVAWLEASGADSWRVYERIGYRATGQRLYAVRG
jgi:ribosomal protein S18 acetylase RimI-like enzyme